MRKQKLNNAKAADLTVFYDENDPQQYLVYSLKFGETVIGGNPDKSSLVLHFTSELDDAHAKITVEDEDYSLEDLGSHKGTFKIKSDNSLIRLKPFKAYDLAPQTAFYLGRFKCIFRAVKTGRNDGLFSLSPLDGHSQRGKDNGLKRQMSYDDIEEDEVFRRSKKGLLQKLSKNQKESELIEEEEEHKEPASRVNLNKVVGQIVSKKDVQSQKQFVKSKGQLPKVEKSKDEENVQLNQSFLKRIQEKLMNSQISKQKDLISEMGAKYSSQSQKKNQDLKSQVKDVEKEDDEETWKLLKIKNSKKGSEKLEEKKKNKEEKIEEKNQNKIDKMIEEIMSTNLGQKIAKVREEKEQKAKQKEEKQSAKVKLDSKVDKKVAEVVNGDNKGKEKKNSKNQLTSYKSTINEKIEKILSNFESEKKDEEKEEIKVKDRKGKAKEKQGKKDQKVTETKKEEEIQKPAQDEIKQKKGKQKKGQKIVEEEEDNEKEMVLEKKSVTVLKGKKNTLKSEIDEDIPKKGVGKQKVEQIKENKEDSPKKISSKKKAEISEDSSKKEKVLLGKRKAAKSEIEVVEEIPKKKVKKADEKEQKGTVKNANTPKKDKVIVKSSSAAKRELAQLISDGNVIQEGARRGKLKVLFSNSCVDDLEREKLRLLGVKIVEDFESASEFNILVTDQIVRRIKILVAINQAIPIVSSEWVKEAIKQQAITPFEPFIISKASKSLSKQYSFDLSQSIIRQFDHPQGVLSGVSFSLPYPLDNISTQELRKLLLSAGATFSSSSSVADTYTITEASKKEQNEELLKLGVKLVSHEGILQSCLLQINVLDDYLIQKAAVSSKKKITKK